jgi:mxaA protein
MVGLLAPFSTFAASPESVRIVSNDPPRTFGIVIGEVLRQEIRIDAAPGFRLDVAQLPQTGSALNDFLEIRQADWSELTVGGKTVYRLNMGYQVFKGVRSAETVNIPALPLRFVRDGEVAEVVEIPAWSFTLSPILAPDLPDENVRLAGALPPPLLSASFQVHALAGWFAGLFGLFLFAAWRLQWPPFRRRVRPFARALKTVRALRKAPPSLDTYSKALRSVHAALDESAGHTLFAGQLDRFFDHHPGHAAVRGELEAFFVVSDRLFFAAGEDSPPAEYPLRRLEDLCRKLNAA